MFHVEQLAVNAMIKCSTCGHQNYLTHLELRDYFLTQEEFTIIKCVHCGLLTTFPQPLPSELYKYYKSTQYLSHATHKKGFEFFLYNRIRSITLASKLELIRKHTFGNTLLDIGCATGVFLNYCRLHGYIAEGIEPNEKARNYAREELKLDVWDVQYLSKLPYHKYDIITMWHVLEHVPDVNERMNTVRNLLKEDGTAFIALPNPNSYDANYYKEYWAAYDVPRHLYHFSIEAFSNLCKKNELQVVNILPMIYDSFYISLLSERYKTGKGSYLNALYRGLRSNLYARSNNLNYSSLIYIVKKYRQG
jgi:2-polyprenyl-3-methyl-5-hydroxy-6-metoxy-1,4-benzoquinol methylase